mmetsp:Transcript_120546/g.221720  ORF Transcript_120546/g.221720 Transcript_120546/m.221720 type:complete len:84 (-) Transcript_120546:93-344(-)
MCTHPGFMTNCVDNWKWHGGANPMHNNNDPAFMPYILRATPGFVPSGTEDGKGHRGAKPMHGETDPTFVPYLLGATCVRTLAL